MDPAGAARGAVGRRRWAGVGGVVAVAAVGTAVALAGDRLVGGLDGRPALHLLIVLALPFWDALPARLGPRLLVLVALLAAIAATWLGLASLRPEAWWRSAVSFGLACALVGGAQVAFSTLARSRRTVDR